MKKFAILFFYILGIAISANAQSFTQHLQQQTAGKGKVSVSHSREIDILVNGVAQDNKSANKPVVTTPNRSGNNAVSVNRPKTSVGKPVNADSAERQKAVEEAAKERAREAAREEERRKIALEKAMEEKKAQEEKKALEEKKAQEKKEERHTAETKSADDDEFNIPTVDMRKKVMRGSKKVTGYRVQVFAGGNTRADKQKAQQAGNAVKLRFPDQPVYVHFYSPRWICRVGNFRSYSQAVNMLKAVKAMGYRSATIVKGKISVFE